MLIKYNIALLPEYKANNIIELSSSFDINFGCYKLGKQSLPHLTITQFYATEEQLKTYWLNICNTVKFTRLELNFNCFSLFTLDEKTYWVSLLPDTKTHLKKMHDNIASLIQTGINNNYDPHITLFSTTDTHVKSILEKRSLIGFSDSFILGLGVCDEVGQFRKVIRKSPL